MHRRALFAGLGAAAAGLAGSTLAASPTPWLAAAGAGFALAAFALARIVAPRGGEVSDRAPLFTLNLVLHCLLVGGCVAALNILAARHPLLVDLTANRRFTLSPQTLAVLASLPREVEVTAFLSESDGGRQALDDLLSLYRAAQPRLRAVFADLNRKPDLASRLGVSSERTVVFESGGRSERLSGIPDETDVTNAILRVSRDRKTMVRFTVGNGERSLGGEGHGDISKLKHFLEAAGFACEPLLLGDGPVPAADAIALVGPKAPLSATAEAELSGFVDRGGSLLVCLEPPPAPAPDGLLAAFGVATTAAVVVDRAAEHPLVPIIVPRTRHPAAADASVACAFPLSRLLAPAPVTPRGWRVEPILVSGRDAYATPGLAAAGGAFDPARDFPGPVTLGVAAERPAAGGDAPPAGRVAVVGNAGFLANGNLFDRGNHLLARSLFAWLAARPELAGLDARPWSAQAVRLAPRDRWAIFWIVLVLIPASLALAGTAVHLRGRS